MIKDIVTSLPLTLSSPHMTKNSTPSSKSSHSFHVYMLSKDCIYSGGGYGGQSVNVMYTIDSTRKIQLLRFLEHLCLVVMKKSYILMILIRQMQLS